MKNENNPVESKEEVLTEAQQILMYLYENHPELFTGNDSIEFAYLELLNKLDEKVSN